MRKFRTKLAVELRSRVLIDPLLFDFFRRIIKGHVKEEVDKIFGENIVGNT